MIHQLGRPARWALVSVSRTDPRSSFSSRPLCRGPSRTSGGIQSRSRSWITGRRQSGVISSVASVIGSLKRRLPALPGFK